MTRIKVVDLFAGPGGLGEGFSRFLKPGTKRSPAFSLACSAEKDRAAVRTLRLRSFYRLCRAEHGAAPASYFQYIRGERPEPFDQATEHLWNDACSEACPLELGTTEGDERLRAGLRDALQTDDPWVLIGGPPCQAYSLVGRSRNRGTRDYKPESDKRHFLYKHYLEILAHHRPAAFVMENVKGILSSRVGNQKLFPQILQDLSEPAKAVGSGNGTAYRIHSLVSPEVFRPGEDPRDLDPRRFVVRSEEHGVPQARHRVILLGIRDDGDATASPDVLTPQLDRLPMSASLLGLPPVRSGLSRGDEGFGTWKQTINEAIRDASRAGLPRAMARDMRRAFEQKQPSSFRFDRGGRFLPTNRTVTGRSTLEREFLNFVRSEELGGHCNHEARGHMPADLARYLFAAVFGAEHGRSPTASEFPEALAPAHRNWRSGHFADRFRVQVKGMPSTTVTSHISKDGHYFIHPEPAQCRSLTVREAARLQTFPDDYFFEGSRTEQYIQVGNAVPPMLATQIAEIVYKAIR